MKPYSIKYKDTVSPGMKEYPGIVLGAKTYPQSWVTFYLIKIKLPSEIKILRKITLKKGGW